jgi:hypothetical protein
MQLPPTTELRECFKCSYSAMTTADVCPRCGKRLQGPKQIRIRGAILIVIGIFLVAFMGGIAAFVAMMLAASMKHPDSAKSINEDRGTLLAIYGLFGLVIVFGLHSIVNGTYLCITGRRSKMLIVVMWILFFALFGAAGLISILVK